MASVDIMGTVAGWLSFLVTAAGLGSLITQTNAIEERLDPFRSARNEQYLGSWISRQPPRPRFRLGRPSPVGPVITANLVNGFCGSNLIGLSRLPLEKTGSASFTVLLAMVHEQPTEVSTQVQAVRSNTLSARVKNRKDVAIARARHFEVVDVEKGQLRTSPSWTSLPAQQLSREGSSSCIAISCATLITILSVYDAGEVYRYSDASGHRAAYGSYSGFWYINWPLGQAAVVSLVPHASHSLATDLYPRTFVRRVDRCVRMTAGVITSPDAKSFQCGFPPRKPPGEWILQYRRKGYSAAHGSRHFYYLVGGKVSEVDFLFARRLEEDPQPNCLRLSLPSREKNVRLGLFIPEEEQQVLEHALDCLPWSCLGWSVHRGLRDILLGYAQPTMNKFRKSLAIKLHAAVGEKKHRLVTLGWSPEFVAESMADIAFTSIMAGVGNSGDAARVVTDIAWLSCSSPNLLDLENMLDLDETTFWREERHGLGANADMSTNAMIALTKFFLLEWSTEFDYKMYEDLPPQLLMR